MLFFNPFIFWGVQKIYTNYRSFAPSVFSLRHSRQAYQNGYQSSHSIARRNDVGDRGLQHSSHEVSGEYSSSPSSYPLIHTTQDNICVRDCDDPDPKAHKMFEQPVIQTAQMFIGEMGCWLFVGGFSLYRRYMSRESVAEADGYQAINTHENGVEDNDTDSIRSSRAINPVAKPMSLNAEDRIPLKGWKVLLLSLPAICDICGTTLMNVGLLFVVPSIYQMTRGALVLFVGLFSVIFLRRTLHLFQWFALFTVVLGVGIVGLAGAIYKDDKAAPATLLLIKEVSTIAIREARTPEALRAIIGVFLIAGAQIFTASQFVLEEYILEKYALEPLKVSLPAQLRPNSQLSISNVK